MIIKELALSMLSHEFGWEGKRDEIIATIIWFLLHHLYYVNYEHVQIAQLVTADSYPSTPYCLPIPSAKFPSIGVE